MGAPVQDGLDCDGTSCMKKMVEGGGPMGGFLYDENEWREICIRVN
jgi:hypothetical protein